MDASKRLLKGNAAGQNQDFQKGFPRSSEPVCILGFYQMMHCSKYKHPARQIFDKLHLAVLQHFAFGVGVPFGFAPMILLQDLQEVQKGGSGPKTRPIGIFRLAGQIVTNWLKRLAGTKTPISPFFIEITFPFAKWRWLIEACHGAHWNLLLISDYSQYHCKICLSWQSYVREP